MIRHMDNFSMYGTNVAFMLNGVWAEVGNIFGGPYGVSLDTDPDGVSTLPVLNVFGGNGGGANYSLARLVLPSLQNKVGIAARYWLTNLPPDTDRKLCYAQWRDVSNNPLYSITVDTTGRLQVRQGQFDGTILYTTTNPVITANGWYHIESALVKGTNDYVEVRVEGAPVITFNVTGTTGVQTAQIAVCNDPTSISISTTFYVKDFIVWDGSGTYNNDFLGACIVFDLQPTSDAALNWTLTGGTSGWSILKNSPPDDTKYITAINPPPAAYVADVNDLPVNVTSVKAIMTMVRAAKSDGGDASLQVGIISSPLATPATVLGANRPITVAQTFWRDVFETDPKTSAAWLPSAVNAARLQINRTV